MITTYRNERSERGYNLSELLSGLQKYIRRGREEEALRCAQELHGFSFAEGGGRIYTNFLHRLQIIFLEDIGLGNFRLWPKMVEWIGDLVSWREKRDPPAEVRTIETAVRSLCRSKKTRAGSYMKMVARSGPEDGCYYPAGPDLAASVLERSPSALAGVMERFVPKVAEMNRLERDLPMIDWAPTRAWREIAKMKEGFLLYLMPVGEYLFGSEELQEWPDCATFGGVWPEWDRFEMDEFVYDKHTKNARNRTTAYFALESSKVFPEVFRTPPEWKALYERVRCK